MHTYCLVYKNTFLSHDENIIYEYALFILFIISSLIKIV